MIKDYISYLKESFLIRILGNYRKSSASTLRKKKRAYPTDSAIIYLYKSKPEKEFFGRVVESAAVNKLGAQSFWKNGNEIDVVYEGVPIEVKYQEQIWIQRSQTYNGVYGKIWSERGNSGDKSRRKGN